MTYIEFVDSCAIENMCAVLTYPVDRVILVGNNAAELEKYCTDHASLMQSKGVASKFIPEVVSNDSLMGTVERLSEIVTRETDGGEECIIDLTGGNDLYLTAAGIVYGKLCGSNRKLNLVRFDIINRTVTDEDGDGLPEFPALPDISVEDAIRVYGGKVVYEKEKKETTHKWTADDRLEADVSALWDICRRDSSWNTQTSLLEMAEKDGVASYKRGNTVECELDRLDEAIAEGKRKGEYSGSKGARDISRGLLDKLTEAGFLKEYSLDGERLKLVYRDEDARRFVTKSGQALEMAVFVAVSGITDSDGKKRYNDVMTGVTIDWDGKIVEKNGYSADTAWYLQTKKDTKNEIDVIAMRGMVPIFISCKNGRVDIDELYKLETVAKRFGGKYGQKILVAPNLNKKNQFTWELISRAKDMGIRVLYENVKSNDVKTMRQRLKDVIESCFRKD